ncbi:SMR domain-containing protein [Citrus sinensis]|uniref:SMR domain-containing protein n=1 Tax=Citrus sinensis TaxID=2711 RepID=A0ACB8IXP8_CITSI|nr:SMR domain-containing protein [Citrus sinensis]
MKEANRKKKKKRSRAAKPAPNNSSRDSNKPTATDGEEVQNDTKTQIIHSLTEAFGSVSLEEATSAFCEANGDVNKAEEILTALTEGNSEDPLTSSSVSGGSSSLDSGSSSGSWLGFGETSCVQNPVDYGNKKGGSRQKRVVAVSGTVANMLGKDYVRASPRKAGRFKGVGDDQSGFDKEEVEQFLYSMLGDECQFSMAVVRDVLCQCGYNVEKAMDVLLDLSAPSNERSMNDDDDFTFKEDRRFITEHTDNFTDRASDCTSYSSESDLYDSIWSTGYNYRNNSKVLIGSKVPSPLKASDQSDLPQKVLESLFNISKSPQHEPTTMNWRNVVKKLQALGPRFDVSHSSSTEPQQELCAKGDEYQVFRKDAKQHWNSMKSCYQKASAAYSKGEWGYAAHLSEQGKSLTKLAQKADEKASHDIFKARNKSFENVITIDLHGQHVKPAMKLLKLHLAMVSYAQSVQTLRVITGCGSHGVGKSKLKQSVIELVENEGLHWSEENRGTVLIKLDGFRELSFLDTDSDYE